MTKPMSTTTNLAELVRNHDEALREFLRVSDIYFANQSEENTLLLRAAGKARTEAAAAIVAAGGRDPRC
jgi:hypothetical protein